MFGWFSFIVKYSSSIDWIYFVVELSRKTIANNRNKRFGNTFSSLAHLIQPSQTSLRLHDLRYHHSPKKEKEKRIEKRRNGTAAQRHSTQKNKIQNADTFTYTQKRLPKHNFRELSFSTDTAILSGYICIYTYCIRTYTSTHKRIFTTQIHVVL